MKPLGLATMAVSVFLACCLGFSMKEPRSSAPRATDEVEKQKPFGSAAIIPASEIESIIDRANRGDAEANYRLYAHYSIGIGDGDKGKKYFERAVALEYPAALYAKAIHLWDSGNADPNEVCRLIKRAMELGEVDSAQILPAAETAQKRQAEPHP